ncbi:MAG: hypothetical protein CSB33_04015 [Desulfobacterales bacterium]|nr:MAG: hypothetical protein CSB33_04015 [Desulfobacterales bacterium]
MSRCEKLETGDGLVMLIEVKDDEDDNGGMQRISRGGRGDRDTDEEEKPPRKFEEAIRSIRPAADAVLRSLQGMNSPDEIGLEFGVKFSAKAGAFMISADSEASFKVALKWTNPAPNGK